MRIRYWTLLAAAVLLAVVAGCAGNRVAREPANTPVPTKTLRPTFTATVPEPTLTPTPTEVPPTATPEEPTATPVPPTPEPTATPEAAVLTVTSASLNVRSGPGTNYGVIGRLTRGQNATVTGKNPAGTWWEFDYDGRTGWVIGTNVTVRNGEVVQVAQNIPAAPTAAPRPTARPVAAQPAPAPAPAAPQVTSKYGITKSELRPNTNPIVSVWCFVFNQSANGLVAGTIRVVQGGATVKEQAFNAVLARGDSGYSSEYLYNDGCKVELPASDGAYGAYLIEGGNQVSDIFNFTVSGSTNRTAIIEWKQR
jgi:hypothetical protein